VVQLNRRTRVVLDEAGVEAKFGLGPASIPDYLALVGDAADGYPGLPGWGAKSAAAVLARYGHLEAIPDDWRQWGVNAHNPAALARTLAATRDLAAHRRASLHRRGGTALAGRDPGLRGACASPRRREAALTAPLSRAAVTIGP